MISVGRDIAKPRKPTDAQILAYLTNRARKITPHTRQQARVELAALERERLRHIGALAHEVRGGRPPVAALSAR